MTDDLTARLWRWLPARTDRTRVTDAPAAAAALDVDVPEVSRALTAMERAGHAVRDRRTGTRAQSWHRGAPPPGLTTGPTRTEEWTLC